MHIICTPFHNELRIWNFIIKAVYLHCQIAKAGKQSLSGKKIFFRKDGFISGAAKWCCTIIIAFINIKFIFLESERVVNQLPDTTDFFTFASNVIECKCGWINFRHEFFLGTARDSICCFICF